ncbi:hypothetical protein LCGC14_2352930 [marine sediment metagenome]|uniref:Uncharacterized protein n=1 Tax=marine sediment metagenome TaxID=412755 RepID=A0A0F9C957_9ZZZZ
MTKQEENIKYTYPGCGEVFESSPSFLESIKDVHELHCRQNNKLNWRREELREGMKEILGDDLINFGITHENPPPHKDCSEECGVSLDDQIAAANPVCSPVRSGGKKHRRCMDCWNEYIDGLVKRIQEKEDSQGVVIKKQLLAGVTVAIDDFAIRCANEGIVAVEPLKG